MDSAELYTQTGMEASLNAFCRHLDDDFPGTINAGLRYELVSCDYAAKTAVFSFGTAAWMSNPGGVAHGGVVAGMMDVAMGSLTYYFNHQKLTPTISLQVSYVRPMDLKRPVLIRVSLSSCGRTMGNVTASAWHEGSEDQIIATASGTYYTAG